MSSQSITTSVGLRAVNLFRGLASEAREGSAFLASFHENMTSAHWNIITGKDEIPDVARFDDSIASTESKMDALAARRAQTAKGGRFKSQDEAEFVFLEAMGKDLRERKKRIQEKYNTMVEAADAALTHLRATSGETVHDVLRTIGVAAKGNRLEQVRQFITHVKAKWMGDPAFVRQQIDASLNGVPGAETRLELETMSNLVDKYRLEQSVHYEENTRAAAAGQIRPPQTDVEYVQFILERVSSDHVSELRTFRDWLINEGAARPRSMAAVKERIGKVCQVKAISLQARKLEESKQQQVAATTVMAAMASVSELTRRVAYLQAENDQQQAVIQANAAVGMDGGGMYSGGGPSRKAAEEPEDRQQTSRNPGIGWAYGANSGRGGHDSQGYYDERQAAASGRDLAAAVPKCSFWDGRQCSYNGECSRSNTHFPGVDNRPEHIRLAAQFGGRGAQPANKRQRREGDGY